MFEVFRPPPPRPGRWAVPLLVVVLAFALPGLGARLASPQPASQPVAPGGEGAEAGLVLVEIEGGDPDFPPLPPPPAPPAPRPPPEAEPDPVVEPEAVAVPEAVTEPHPAPVTPAPPPAVAGGGGEASDGSASQGTGSGEGDGDGLMRLGEGEVQVRHRVQPRYPDEARALALDEVRCTALVQVDAAGRPEHLQVGGCPEPFARSSREALYQWRWYPPRREGRPVRGEFPLTVVYRLGPPPRRS